MSAEVSEASGGTLGLGICYTQVDLRGHGCDQTALILMEVLCMCMRRLLHYASHTNTGKKTTHTVLVLQLEQMNWG